MAFDITKFNETRFTERTEDVPVEELNMFFDEKEKPVWKIRGLTSHEIAEAEAAVSRNKNVNALIEKLLSETQKEKLEGIKELVGMTDKTPDDIVKRLAHLRIGSIAPECTQEMAVRLANVFPTVFYDLTNKIYRLTGMGQTPGK